MTVNFHESPVCHRGETCGKGFIPVRILVARQHGECEHAACSILCTMVSCGRRRVGAAVSGASEVQEEAAQ